jgi:ABC-type dipeptide/oligopeptide/nickel transport system permease subunit
MRRPSLAVGLLLLAGLLILTVAVPLLTADPNATDYAAKLLPPSWTHPLGTDEAGRDVLARLAAGARVSLGTALLVGVLGFVAGLLIGLLAATVGGPLDAAIARLTDVTLAVPHVVLALAIVGVLGPGLANLVLAMALAGWAPMARYARRFGREQLGQPYVLAARLAGVARWRAVARHVVPPSGLQLLAIATLGLGEIVLSLSALSFLGLGVAPPTAEWGRLVADSRTYAGQAPWLVVAPGCAIVLAVTCAALLADALRERVRR